MNRDSSSTFDAAVQSHAAEQANRPGFNLVRAWQALSLADIRQHLIGELRRVGIDEAETEARFLIAYVLAPHTFTQAVADSSLWSWQSASRLADLAALRLTRIPLSQVLGSQPFWTLDLKVTADVLTPRADTETLVEVALGHFRDGGTVVDLGTGSGAIVLAILSERPNATGIGIDSSPAALKIAEENAQRSVLAGRCKMQLGNWADGLASDHFDLAVSNPPYITRAVMAALEPEVRDYEPPLALDGGVDGLDAYRVLIPELFRILCPGGHAVVEIGYDQAEPVQVFFSEAGFANVTLAPDLAGQPRVVAGMKVKTASG